MEMLPILDDNQTREDRATQPMECCMAETAIILVTWQKNLKIRSNQESCTKTACTKFSKILKLGHI